MVETRHSSKRTRTDTPRLAPRKRPAPTKPKKGKDRGKSTAIPPKKTVKTARKPKPQAKRKTTPSISLTGNGVSVLREGKVSKPLQLQVLDVFRYQTDASIHLESTGSSSAAVDDDVFDVILSDGANKIKCILMPSLNDLVRKGVLFPLRIVRVTEAVGKYDETKLNEPMYVIIRAMEVIKDRTDEIILKNKSRSIEFSPDACDREQKCVPRLGNRGYYLSVWADDVPVGDAWDTSGIDQAKGLKYPQNHPTISQIVDTSSRPSPLPSLIGRVLRKSRLVRLQPHAKALEKFPFNFTMSIGDRSGAIEVVVWARACLKFFKQVNEGDAIAIDGYKLKHKFGSPHGDWEVSIDAVNPVGSITHLTNAALVTKLKLPSMDYELRTSTQLFYIPDNTIFDMIGQIAAIDEPEREPVKKGRGFAEFRWVYLRDSASETLLPIQVYSNSSDTTLEGLKPLDLVLLTHIELHSVTRDSVNPREMHARTTFHTHIYVNDTMPRLKEITALKQWSKKDGKGGSTTALIRSLGPLRQHGYKRALLLKEPTLEAYRSTFPKIPIKPLSEVSDMSDKLSLREKADVLVQAHIIRMEEKGVNDGVTTVTVSLVDINHSHSMQVSLPLYHGDDTVKSALVEAFPPSFIPSSIRTVLTGPPQKKRRGKTATPTFQQILADFSSVIEDQRVVLALSLYRQADGDVNKVISMVFNPTV